MRDNISNVKKNFAYQSVYQILTMFLPLVTAPYIARVLGAENVGIYSYTYIIANYFVIIAMLGLEQYGSRSIAKVRDNKELLSKTFSELIFLHVLFSIIIVAVYYIYAIYFSGIYKYISLLQGFYVCSAVFDINWFFFGIEKFKVTVTRNIIIKLLSVILVFLLVHDKSDLWVYTLIMSASVLISQVILWVFVCKYATIQLVDLKSILYHIKPMLALFVAVIAANIYRMIDKVMLGGFDQMVDLGCYEYADKIIRIPLSLITALGTVMLSKMSYLYAKNEKEQVDKMLDASAMFVVFLSFGMAFGIASIAPEFTVIFLGEEYQGTVILLMILAITIPIIGWNNFVRTQILIPMSKDKIYIKAVIVGAIVNVCLNVVFIKLYNAKGAAIATIFSYIAVMLIQTMPLIKTTKVVSYIRFCPFPVIIGIVMFIVVRLIGNTLGVAVITVIIQIITGGILYTVGTLVYLNIFKPEFFNKYILKPLKRLL